MKHQHSLNSWYWKIMEFPFLCIIVPFILFFCFLSQNLWEGKVADPPRTVAVASCLLTRRKEGHERRTVHERNYMYKLKSWCQHFNDLLFTLQLPSLPIPPLSVHVCFCVNSCTHVYMQCLYTHILIHKCRYTTEHNWRQIWMSALVIHYTNSTSSIMTVNLVHSVK